MILALLLACDPEPQTPWTPEAALTPTLSRLDRDGDGRVTAPEWEGVRFAGPPFGEVDRDGDGALSVDELGTTLREQDALDFDLDPRQPPPPPPPPIQPSGSPEERILADELLFLRREIAHARPDLALPTPEAIKRAAKGGDPSSAELAPVLAALREGWQQTGRPLPPLLTEAP